MNPVTALTLSNGRRSGQISMMQCWWATHRFKMHIRAKITKHS